MLIFERLHSNLERPYDGVFSDEFDYSGLGQYQDIDRRQVRELEKKAEDLKAAERSILLPPPSYSVYKPFAFRPWAHRGRRLLTWEK